MTRYVCEKCSYRFSPKSQERKPRMCPYCGKSDTLKEEESIDSMIQNIDEKDENPQ